MEKLSYKNREVMMARNIVKSVALMPGMGSTLMDTFRLIPDTVEMSGYEWSKVEIIFLTLLELIVMPETVMLVS